MTSRFAALIHRQFDQQGRAVPPGIALATAAIVAVVLFLVTTTNARADVPTEEPNSAVVCGDIASGSISIVNQTISRSADASDGSCSLRVAGRPPAKQGDVPTNCQVSYTPAATSSGLRVSFTTTGECDGVTLRSETSVLPPSAATDSDAQASAAGYAAAYAKLVGEESFSIDTFYNKSKVAWGYTSTSVNSATHYPSDWVLWFGWWVTTRSSSLTRQGETSYQGYNRVKFRAFQNTHADTKTTLIAKPGGAFSCVFSITWTNKPLLFDHYTECDAE